MKQTEVRMHEGLSVEVVFLYHSFKKKKQNVTTEWYQYEQNTEEEY